VLLLPLSKISSSVPRMKLVRSMAGVKEELIFGSGRSIGFNIGFPVAAVNFIKGYCGPTYKTWYEPQ
jgi:hypothetical protein